MNYLNTQHGFINAKSSQSNCVVWGIKLNFIVIRFEFKFLRHYFRLNEKHANCWYGVSEKTLDPTISNNRNNFASWKRSYAHFQVNESQQPPSRRNSIKPLESYRKIPTTYITVATITRFSSYQCSLSFLKR